MKILAAITVIIILLMIYSVKIIYEISLVNFDFSASIKLKTPFVKEVYNSKKPKKKKKSEPADKVKPSGRKMDLETITQLKKPVTLVLSEVCKILKTHCRILKIETMAKTALEDPMENGIAFGIVSGVLNVTTLIIKDKCRIKNTKLEILSDFNSGEGLIFKSCGTLRIRPVLLIFAILTDIKLLKEIKNIIVILKREEKQNG